MPRPSLFIGRQSVGVGSKQVMDLLGSILNSMDKPPTPSEQERLAAKEMKQKLEKEQAIEKKKREELRSKVIKQIGVFLEDGTKKRMKFSPMNKVFRSIVHEVAETAGLIAHSFGTEEVDRYVMLFKKEYAPSEEELQALRRGEEFDLAQRPSETNVQLLPNSAEQSDLSIKKAEPLSNYREKYKHLIATEISEPTAVKTEPERHFGFVPSANKRDIRSIEETLKDLRSKKRAKLLNDFDDTDEQC